MQCNPIAIRFFYGSQKVKGLVVFPPFDNQWHAFKTRFTSDAPFLKALSEEYSFLRVCSFIHALSIAESEPSLITTWSGLLSSPNFSFFASSSFSQPQLILKSR